VGSIGFDELEVMAGGDCEVYWLSCGDQDSHVVVGCLELLRFSFRSHFSIALFVYRTLSSVPLDSKNKS